MLGPILKKKLVVRETAWKANVLRKPRPHNLSLISQGYFILPLASPSPTCLSTLNHGRAPNSNPISHDGDLRLTSTYKDFCSLCDTSKSGIVGLSGVHHSHFTRLPLHSHPHVGRPLTFCQPGGELLSHCF